MAGEICRRLLNTSMDLVSAGYAEEDIDKFLYKLMQSGYGNRERSIIERQGTARYENILAKVNEGKRLLYRHSSEDKLGRALKKLVEQKKWHRKEIVLFTGNPWGNS